jgi:metal-dependent HD superfamily phosphatase/phosphodiesterase
MQITIDLVKNNPFVINFIEQTEKYMKALGFTDHGFRHVNIVSERARSLAKKLNLSGRDQELSAIAGYCHDMANFLGREQHHYWAALLFSQVFMSQISPNDLSVITQAIVTHDKDELKIVSKVAAVLILADKSDVHRTRTNQTTLKNLTSDIHDRVNYATTDNQLAVSGWRREIILKLKIDTKVAEPIEYFEIFIDRMAFCRQAAKYLGYKFVLVVNNFKLS